MKYDVAAVSDLGDKLEIKYVDTYQNSMLKNDGPYVKISNVAGDVIREALSEHKRVYITKNIQGELCVSDIIIYETDGLERDKMIALSNVYRKMDYCLFNVSAMDYFDFLGSFSVLASLGYFITDNNREEKYLEIIESGDENLISALEIYLENKDKLEKISYIYNKVRQFEKNVMICNTVEDLNNIIKDFDV